MIKPAVCLALLSTFALTGCVSPSSKPTPALVITTTSLSSAAVGSSYTAQIQVTGGTAPYTYSAAGLPSALSISTATGTIAGTPAQSAIGTATVVVTVSDNSKPQKTTTAKLSLAVTPATLTFTTTALPNAIAGSPYTAVLGVTGGVTPYSYAASGLPSGLGINSSTGAITGSASSAAVGTSSVKFTVTDAETTPQTASATLSIKVLASGLSITTAALPDGVANQPYSTSIAASGGTPPYTFSASGLPASLSINSSTGAFTGTPTSSEEGTTQVTFTVADSSAPAPQQVSAPINLTIDASSSAAACKSMSLGENANLNGFVPFPANNEWNLDVSSASLDANNTTITSSAEFSGKFLHPDFSSVAGGNYGIPYTVVDSGSTSLVSIAVTDYASESDVALAPFPITAPVEGSPTDCTGWPNTYVGDAHVLVLDRATCMLYETFNTHRCTGQWSASSETIWDMQNDEGRPWGWTSADAGGLPIFPGLLRYDEVASGAIHHAIRFTMPHTRSDANGGYFVIPASHAAGNSSTAVNIMGMRIRLKASFDISGFSAANQVILTAMKKYGLILADNGSAFYFQGAPDTRWDDNDLNNLKTIGSGNFEIVQMTPAYPGYDSASAPAGALPVINSFSASSTSITAGMPVTLSWNTANDTYDFIDKLGGVHGNSITVTPSVTTTYTLYATSHYGRTSQQITITVN